MSNELESSSLEPYQVVPILLDKGIYLGAESSFYRLLNECDQLNHQAPMSWSTFFGQVIGGSPIKCILIDLMFLDTHRSVSNGP